MPGFSTLVRALFIAIGLVLVAQVHVAPLASGIAAFGLGSKIRRLLPIDNERGERSRVLDSFPLAASALLLIGAAIVVLSTANAGKVLFRADAETGDASQWCFVHSAVSVGVVSNPARSGDYAYRSEIRDGELIYKTERSEYANGPKGCTKHRYAPEDETWTAVSIYLTPDFPYYSDWSLVTQWHEPYGGTPPQQINLEKDRWHIVGSNTLSPRPRWELAPIRRGQWEDFVVHHKWSTDPTVGFVEVYLNGKLVLPKTYTRTIDNDVPLFLSVGQYRSLRNEGTAVLYIDDVKVGTTHDSVR
jgi:hypothetical protein